MSGLCGWIGPKASGSPAELILSEMAEKLGAGGTSTGSAVSLEAGLALNSRFRSSSFAGGPGQWAAVEGSIRWQDAECSRLASASGHAAALLAAHQKFGLELFDHIGGHFSFAIIDTQKNSGLIATDKVASKPVYYAVVPTGGIVFGSDAQSVRSHPASSATMSPQGIYNYFYFYMCPAPQTIYVEQKKLLAAQYLRFDGDRAEVGFHWQPQYAFRNSRDADGLCEELRSVLRTAVCRSVEGENIDRTGAFLSGGLDSSTVSGLLGNVSGEPAKCFTVGFDEPKFDESEYAHIAANHFGAEFHRKVMKPADVLEAVDLIARHYGEPFSNSSAAAAYFCAKRARESGIDLLLAGDGGDELFAGNERYGMQGVYEYYNLFPKYLRERILKPVLWNGFLGTDSKLLSRARNYVTYAETPLPDRLQVWNWMHSRSRAEAFEEDFLADLDQGDPLEVMRAPYGRARAQSPLQKMLYMDLQLTLSDNDLPKVNRTCEIAGIDVRFPFLDDDVLELSTRIPPDLLIRRGELRYLFKRAFRNYLPKATISKSKHGFGLPFNEWAATDKDLQALVMENLIAFKQRGIMKPAFIDYISEANRTGSDMYLGDVAWDIVLLELWLQHH